MPITSQEVFQQHRVTRTERAAAFDEPPEDIAALFPDTTATEQPAINFTVPASLFGPTVSPAEQIATLRERSEQQAIAPAVRVRFAERIGKFCTHFLRKK